MDVIICMEHPKNLSFLKISPKYDILMLYKDDIYRYFFKFARILYSIGSIFNIIFKNADISFSIMLIQVL